MRKFAILAFVCMASFSVQAQDREFKSFKFDIALGLAMPTNGTGTKAGVLFAIQPHYRVNDNFALGLRLEGAGIGYVYNDINGNQNVDVSVIGSGCVSGEIYLSKNRFRPFIGGGIGVFNSQGASTTSNGNGDVVLGPSATSFGGYPEIGFEAGHFRLCADYNITGHDISYFSLKIGAFFGGGRIK